MTKRLQFEDREKVSGLLQDLSHDELMDLGICLGISDSFLQNMEEVPDDLVMAWLSGQHEDQAQSAPTLEMLSHALKDIGCSDVAAKIEAEARRDRTEETTRITSDYSSSTETEVASACLTFTMKEYEKKLEAKCKDLERKIEDVEMIQSTELKKLKEEMRRIELQSFQQEMQQRALREELKLQREWREQLEQQRELRRELLEQQRTFRQQLERRKELRELQQNNDDNMRLLKQQVEKLEHKMRVQPHENEKMEDSEKKQLEESNKKLTEFREKELRGVEEMREKMKIRNFEEMREIRQLEEMRVREEMQLEEMRVREEMQLEEMRVREEMKIRRFEEMIEEITKRRQKELKMGEFEKRQNKLKEKREVLRLHTEEESKKQEEKLDQKSEQDSEDKATEMKETMDRISDERKKAVDKDLQDQRQALEKHKREVEEVDKQLKKFKEEMKRLLKDRLRDLEQRMKKQVNKQEELEQRIKVQASPSQPTGPVVLKMHNYDHYQRHGGDWFSSGFYTHGGGYKMCLGISAKGFGRGAGSHISVYLHMMRGEFDAHLKWPFKGRITVQLVSRRGDKGHYAKTIPFNDERYAEPTKKVVEGERNPVGCGFEKFISHDEIKHYNKNDSLQFEITKVAIIH